MKWRHSKEQPEDNTDAFLLAVESAMGLMDDLKRNTAAITRAIIRAGTVLKQLHYETAKAEQKIAELKKLRSK